MSIDTKETHYGASLRLNRGDHRGDQRQRLIGESFGRLPAHTLPPLQRGAALRDIAIPRRAA